MTIRERIDAVEARERELLARQDRTEIAMGELARVHKDTSDELERVRAEKAEIAREATKAAKATAAEVDRKAAAKAATPARTNAKPKMASWPQANLIAKLSQDDDAYDLKGAITYAKASAMIKALLADQTAMAGSKAFTPDRQAVARYHRSKARKAAKAA